MIKLTIDDRGLIKELNGFEGKLKKLKNQPDDKFVRKHFKFKSVKELEKDIEDKGSKSLDDYLKKHSKFKNKKDMVDKVFKEIGL